MAEMFAAVAEAPGGPEVIRFTQQHPVPLPGKKELRIRIAAASLNPIDCHRRAGYGRRMMKLLGAAEFPMVLGSDFAGVVDAVGSQVSGWKPGDRVFGCKAASRAGTHAQFAVVPVAQVLRLPEGLTMEEAATLPYSFVTAYRLITAGLKWSPADCRKRRFLVHGGLGAVGSMAVRLLTHWGAAVIISDREPRGEDWRGTGAEAAIDLSQARPGRPAGKYDAILNCASFQREESLFPLLKQGGRYATIVHPLIATLDEHGWIKGGMRARSIWRAQADRLRACGGESYRWVLFRPDPQALHTLDSMAKQGLLKSEIARVYNVNEAVEAHRQMALGGLRGKIVLQMSANNTGGQS